MQTNDLLGISEPASKLIEYIAKAAGVLFEPRRIVRAAKANAEATLIATDTDLEVEDRRRRAADRFVAETLQKQENLESIVGAASRNLLPDTKSTTELDPDWTRRFVGEAQNISDEGMQAYWARLLSGEFNAPGTYPRRLLSLLKDLDPKDAKLIESIASKALKVEQCDGSVTSCLILSIEERWMLGPDHNTGALSENTFAGIDLLEELGLVFPHSHLFEISVEGSMTPEAIELSPHSAKRIFVSVGDDLRFGKNQPHSIKVAGSSLASDGRPRINKALRSIAFSGHRLTQLGQSMFALAASAPDLNVLAGVRKTLVDARIQLVE